MGHSPLTTIYDPANVCNYTIGREGNKVQGIVVHHSGGTNFDSIGAGFKKDNYNASAHYGISNDGKEIGCYVDEEDTAWQAGNWGVNLRTVGIECCDIQGSYTDPSIEWLVSDATFNTLVRLCAEIARRNNLGRLVFGENLFGHRDFQATLCPSNKLYARLGELCTKSNEINYPYKVGWNTDTNGKFYSKDGKTKAYKLCWVNINHYRYYFDKKGYVKTGLRKIENGYYYFKKSGSKIGAMMITDSTGKLKIYKK